MGMSNLPDFRSWTGPARSVFLSESGGGNCEMSTLVPMEASGGMILHPGPGPAANGPGPGCNIIPPLVPLPLLLAPLCLAPKLCLAEALPFPVSLRRRTPRFSAVSFLRQNESNPSNPLLVKNRSEDVCGHLSTRYVQTTAVTRLTEQP